ncbi:hypothetical protein FTUN_7300 [Frigoriglobus tundricola]|uniref:Uncharacterized protein n=1 Tax=Frigoriglobus tundricola TaxID=2774151 RepID=A0A6M5Z2L7_9BACT|nr:hypothetical protein FTUN_7300 [Frigoriglobus tundricola]
MIPIYFLCRTNAVERPTSDPNDRLIAQTAAAPGPIADPYHETLSVVPGNGACAKVFFPAIHV